MEQAGTIPFKAEEPCSSFPKFRHLPPELRIKIWQHAIPGPRTVIVVSSFTGTKNRAPKSLEDALSRTLDTETLGSTWRSRTHIPTLLHVNAEARHEALQYYQLSLGVGTAQPRVYIDISRDTPFFGHAELKPECSGLWASTTGLQKVRRLAIVPESAWRVVHWQTAGWKALEKIIFVHEADDLSLGPQQQLVEDDPDDSPPDMGLDPQTRAQILPEETEREERRPQERDAQETATSLESAMTRCKHDPIMSRMQAAREEVDILMQVLPAQWDKEPTVSTAVFREGPGQW